MFATPCVGQERSLAQLDSFIQQQAEKFHIPGIAACVVKGNKVVWSNGYGYANIAREVPMTPQKVINIASVSKTITATAIMQLWEKNKLSLDTPVEAYIDFPVRNPAFPDRTITVR